LKEGGALALRGEPVGGGSGRVSGLDAKGVPISSY